MQMEGVKVPQILEDVRRDRAEIVIVQKSNHTCRVEIPLVSSITYSSLSESAPLNASWSICSNRLFCKSLFDE